MSFKEVHIRVSRKVEAAGNFGFLVELYDVAAETVLASEDVPRAVFETGFPEFKNGEGETLTPARLAAEYREDPDGLKNAMVAGKLLFKLLMPGAVATAWEKLKRDSKTRQNARLAEWRKAMKSRGKADGEMKEPEEDSLVSLLDLPPEWMELPWELLHHGEYLCCERQHTFGHVTRGEPPEANPNWPLRMLVVVGCDATDVKAGWNNELQEIRQAAALFSLRLDLEILKAPHCTPEAIRLRLETFRPHIFHFIGHGIAGEYEGYLQLELAGGGYPWTASQIITDLGAVVYLPWIVVLNACEADGGNQKVDEEDPEIIPVADAFRQCGCGTTIAMRGKITREGCTAYTRGFYQKLARCGLSRPDLAHAEGVNAIARVTSYANRTTWSQPRCIHLHSLGKVFPMNPSTGLQDAMGEKKNLEKIKTFVGRDVPRRRVFNNGNGQTWFQPGTEDPRVMVVGSRGRNGKSWFLMSQVYLASLEGYETFYCDFGQASGNTLEFLEILKTIRNTAHQDLGPFFGQPLVRPARQEAFQPFVDEAEKYEKGTSAAENPQLVIIQELANALRGADHRIFIALDHVHKTNPVIWRDLLVKELLQKVATDETFRHVRIAVALDDDQISSHGFMDQFQVFEPGRLEEIPLEELEDYFLRLAFHRLGEMKGKSEHFHIDFIKQTQEMAESRAKIQRMLESQSYPISCLIF